MQQDTPPQQPISIHLVNAQHCGCPRHAGRFHRGAFTHNPPVCIPTDPVLIQNVWYEAELTETPSSSVNERPPRAQVTTAASANFLRRHRTRWRGDSHTVAPRTPDTTRGIKIRVNHPRRCEKALVRSHKPQLITPRQPLLGYTLISNISSYNDFIHQ